LAFRQSSGNGKSRGDTITWTYALTSSMTGLWIGSGTSATLATNKLDVAGNAAIGSTYAGTAAPVNGLIVSGNVGIGTTNPTAKLQVIGQMVSQQQTIASGGTVDFSTGNIQVLKSVGGSSITLNNMQDGAAYTLFITDTTNRTYTFNNCANSHWIQPNATTNNSATLHTMYSIVKLTISDAVHCYISWISGI